jgi:preprotein translocase subunit SecG
MILKVLLTLAIVIAVFIWFRSQNSKRLNSNGSANGRLITDAKVKNQWIKPFSYSMAGLVIAGGILVYYLSWQEGHTPYQVTITNPQTGTIESFIALKKDMHGRLFITQSGREIWVSDLERIEVKKLTTGSD